MQSCGNRREGFFPTDLDPFRVLIRPFVWVRALERFLEAIRIISIVHARGALRTDSVIVEVGARDIRIDRAHNAVHHGRLDAAKIRADRAVGLDALYLRRGGQRYPLRGFRSRGDDRKLAVETGKTANRTDACEKDPSAGLHEVVLHRSLSLSEFSRGRTARSCVRRPVAFELL